MPGYNYLGPGNSLDKGKPTSRNDAIAREHDEGYDRLIKQGHEPYWNYNAADEKGLREWDFSDFGGIAAQGVFRGKKLLAKAGIFGTIPDAPTTPGRKRPRDAEGTTLDPVDKPVAKRRNIRDGETSSVTNLPPNGNMPDAIMASGDGSGNEHGLKETPVDDPFMVHRGLPDYTFSSLPYTEEKGILMGSDTWGIDHVWRMNSPYDPAVTLTNVDINPGAGTAFQWQGTTDAADASIVPQANWFGYYASIYNYYHVLSCRYNVYIENKGAMDIVAHQMFYNDEQPPNGATNTDIMLWKGTRTEYLKSPFNAVTSANRIETNQQGYDANPNNRNEEGDVTASGNVNYEANNHVVSRSGHVSCNFSGVYSPGDFRREIRLDSQVENWTSVSANPLLPERLLIRIKPESNAIGNDIQNYGQNLVYKLVVKLEYLVEFKELKSGLRWPVQRNPALVTINTDYFTSTG